MPSITFQRYTDYAAPVQPMQEAIEFERLLEIYQWQKPRRVLEIGTLEGGTLYQWLKHGDCLEHVTCVDLPGARWGKPDTWNGNMWGDWAQLADVNLSLIAGDSHDEKTITAVQEHGHYSFIFIDGDHTYSGAKQDFDTYSAMLSPNGIIALHDIVKHDDPAVGVWQLWREIKKSYENTIELISHEGQRHMGIGVVLT